MPVDPTPSRIATQQLQLIPFGSLIGAPLDAAITAQGQAALTSADFIRSVGLQKTMVKGREADDQEKEVWEAITVAFTYSDSTGQPHSLVVPLLAIVPIPYIGIDNINIDFKANISAESSSSLTTTTSTGGSGEASGQVGSWFWKTNFKANYSSKRDSTATANSKYSVEYTMDVNVSASQSDMPSGLATILQILNNSIVSRNPTGDLIVLTNGALRISSADEELNLDIVAVNGDNKGVGGVVITGSASDSSNYNITVEKISNTDAFGRTTAKLTGPKTLPASPEAVAVTFVATINGTKTSETVMVTVG